MIAPATVLIPQAPNTQVTSRIRQQASAAAGNEPIDQLL